MNQVRDQILKSIVNSGLSSLSPSKICETIQCPPNVVEDCLFDLETNGLVVAWESEQGLVVTLTPISAAKLGVHLVDYNDNSYWVGINTTRRSQPINRKAGDRTGRMELIIDEMPGPEEIAILAEEVGAISIMAEATHRDLPKLDFKDVVKFDEFSLPYPTVLLGTGSALWDNMHYDVCPGCKSKELSTHEYCLRCDSWGMDRYLEKFADRIKIRAYAQREADNVNVVKRVENRKEKHHSRIAFIERNSGNKWLTAGQK